MNHSTKMLNDIIYAIKWLISGTISVMITFLILFLPAVVMHKLEDFDFSKKLRDWVKGLICAIAYLIIGTIGAILIKVIVNDLFKLYK